MYHLAADIEDGKNSILKCLQLIKVGFTLIYPVTKVFFSSQKQAADFFKI